MRTSLISFLLVVALFMSGCCKFVAVTPDRPASVRGWQKYKTISGFTAIGEFVLKKGESIENDKFGVQLVSVVRPQNCSGYLGEDRVNPRARVRIFDASTKQTLAEVDVTVGSTSRLINVGFPIEKYGLDTIYPWAINTEDEWIWIEFQS